MRLGTLGALTPLMLSLLALPGCEFGDGGGVELKTSGGHILDSRAWALRVMTGRSIDGDVVCAYGVRLIGDVPGAPPLGAHPSRGYVHGYHCALAQKQAADTVAAHLLALFDGLGPRRD